MVAGHDVYIYLGISWVLPGRLPCGRAMALSCRGDVMDLPRLEHAMGFHI